MLGQEVVIDMLEGPTSKKYIVKGGWWCAVRLEHPPGGGGITQISATPRHILSVTNTGECWTHEEGKVGNMPQPNNSFEDLVWFE